MLTAPVLPCASGAVYLHFVGRAAGCKDLLLLAGLARASLARRSLPWRASPRPGRHHARRDGVYPENAGRFGNGLGSCRSVSACVFRAAAIGMKDSL